MKPVLVSVTFPDLPSARRMARVLLEKKLAACVNFFPVESYYRWRGKTEKAKEVILLAKTAQPLVARLEKAILENHPYETPCLERWPTRANRSCQLWLEEELGVGATP